VMNSTEGMAKWVRMLHTHGYSIVTGTPATAEATQQVMAQLGYSSHDLSQMPLCVTMDVLLIVVVVGLLATSGQQRTDSLGCCGTSRYTLKPLRTRWNTATLPTRRLPSSHTPTVAIALNRQGMLPPRVWPVSMDLAH
jgi:hypothetical protein